MTVELQDIMTGLITAAQKVSYELATLEPKESYTKEELGDLIEANKELVRQVKRLHKLLERFRRG
jgi:hypothetical protein